MTLALWATRFDLVLDTNTCPGARIPGGAFRDAVAVLDAKPQAQST
jgi:hypothetical protein